MTAMLASDVNNPAFVGPVNPDLALEVVFYMHAPEDVHKSEAAGKLVRGDPIPYVSICAPGDHTSKMESPVMESHKRRFPDKWLYFQIANNMIEGAAEIPGWPLEQWTHLNPEQVRELKFARFSVVEQLANASDAQCQRIGMNGMSLRTAARTALGQRMNAEVAEEMKKKDAEISALKAANDGLAERMAKFEAFMAAADTAKPAPLKARSG